jgi:hypothetical protein
LWSFLSRGVSPYTQEGLFIDAFPGINGWIKKAADGKFTEADLPAYKEWAATTAPKGSGQPGASAAHNLNAFGTNFLLKMGERGEDGISHLQRIHDMMSDPNMTGQQIRREFMTGVVPTKFKVTEAGNEPWYQRPGVNKERLDERAKF